MGGLMGHTYERIASSKTIQNIRDDYQWKVRPQCPSVPDRFQARQPISQMRSPSLGISLLWALLALHCYFCYFRNSYIWVN